MKKIVALLLFVVVSCAVFGQDFEVYAYTFDKRMNKKEFISIFNKSKSIETSGLSITDKKNNLLFDYSVNAGPITITKINDSTFSFVGSFSFPYADVWASCEVGEHIFKIRKNGIIIEKTKLHANYPKLDLITLNNISEKYNRMKRDTSFTNENWELITNQNADSVINICYDLTLGILNGCKPCIPLFMNIKKDFSVILFGECAEMLQGCETVLQKYASTK